MSQHASKTGSVVIADVLETIRQNHLQILWTEVLMSGTHGTTGAVALPGLARGPGRLEGERELTEPLGTASLRARSKGWFFR